MDHFAEEVAKNAKPELISGGMKTAMKLGAAIVVLLGVVGGVSYSYGSFLKEKRDFEITEAGEGRDEKSTTSVPTGNQKQRQFSGQTQGNMTQSAPAFVMEDKFNSLSPELQAQISQLSMAIQQQLAQQGALSPDLLIQIDSTIYDIAKPAIQRATKFSAQNRRDVLWKKLSGVDESNNKKKSETMLKNIIDQLDQALYSMLITCSANEQHSIRMAIENATNDCLGMINLPGEVYAENVQAASQMIPQLKQMSQMKMQQIIVEGDKIDQASLDKITIPLLKELLTFKTAAFKKLTPIIEAIATKCKEFY